MSSVPRVLIPMTPTTATLTASTIAEPAASETAWVSAGTYVVGDLRIRTTTHRVYKCVAGHTGRTGLPEAATEAAYWLDVGPTLRWAAWDTLVNTKSTGTTSISWTFLPGTFINAVALYGILSTSATVRVQVNTGPGGASVFDQTYSTLAPAVGFWEYYHAAPVVMDKMVVKDIPLTLNPEVIITVAGTSGAAVGVGMIAVGDLRPLTDPTTWGGTQFGAQAKPTTYSYISTDSYGNTTIVKRPSATDMSIKIEMPHAQSDYALQTVQSVLDVPAAWIATDSAGYSGLNVFGLASGSLTYTSYNLDIFTIDIRGLT